MIFYSEEDFLESLKTKYVTNGLYYDSVESYQINGEIDILYLKLHEEEKSLFKPEINDKQFLVVNELINIMNHWGWKFR